MSFFEWDAKVYSVKVQEMDKEHIILIDKMNKLYEANEKNQPFETIKNLLEDFGNYTVTHFRDEEAFMEKIKFEGVEIHKEIHRQLLTQFQKHVTEFESTKVLSRGFFNFLKVWLTSHIRGIDMKYSEVANRAA